MKSKAIIFLFLFCFIFSCKNIDQNDFVHVDLSGVINLEAPDVIYSFDDKYPTDISIRDSIAYIVQIKSDYCLMALNLNTRQVIQSFGISGHGPNDIIFPLFISSIDHEEVLLQDGFSKQFNVVDFNKQTEKYVVNKYMDYSNKIFRSSETNISKNLISGRKSGAGKMFYVYGINTDELIEIDFYPEIKDLNPNIDLNYLYAPSIAMNEERNRILAGMYFFDMFHVYDLSGKRIKTCCFSKNFSPSTYRDVTTENIIQKCSEGLVRVFPTRDYCYFLRSSREYVDNMLIQVNWDGELMNIYHTSDEIEGQFYIDEKEKKMYIIRHRLLSAIEEVFEVVSYLLN